MFPKPEEWTEGVYFGLDEKTYHAIPWLGSSNIKELYSSPPDYWFNSHMNPMREEEEDSSAFKFGKALHYRILHGEEEFRKVYQPIQGGTKTGEVGADELKEWLKSKGAAPGKTKADNERMTAETFGVTLVAEKQFNNIIMAAAMILKNPHLSQAFTNGWPEVSIFWIDNGVKCKARLDWLKSGVIVDLKSFRSKERISQLDKWITQDLYNYRYDIQQAHYIAGYEAMAELLAKGLVYTAPGATRPDDSWLKTAAAKTPQWVFIFYKADGMPIAKSYQVAHGGFVHDMARIARRMAMDNYRDNLEKFGTEAWVNMDPPYMLDQDDIPKWAGY